MHTLCADFETTVYEGQTSTEVWASAVVETHTEDVHIFGDIDSTFLYLLSFKENLIVYYHNLKFDGNFWLYYLITQTDYKPNYIELDDGTVQWGNQYKMPSYTYQYTISNMGQWYTIFIQSPYGRIEIRDSLKLLPFKLDKIGKSFKTKHQKLTMEYEGERYANCNITDEEKEYIKNDVLVLKEAIEIMQQQKHDKLTIGSCCLTEFKSEWVKAEYDNLFPDLTKVLCPIDGFDNCDQYIRKSYRGGWCYLKANRANKRVKQGITLDVNSLYPSMMHSMSGNRFPIGLPNFWVGAMPKDVQTKDKYFFIHIRTRFRLKKDHLPMIQIKGNLAYKSNEWLATSDIRGKDGIYYPSYTMFGKKYESKVDLYLTMTDYYLLHEQYELYDYEEIDGCWFYTANNLFDVYINKYKEIKMNSKGAIRELAKLFLNNLYGKFGASDDSSFKVAYIADDGALRFKTMEAHDKRSGYIPIGSAITGYARNFTIRAAQANYKYFIYADTDSIHCGCTLDDITGAPLHNTEFCHWKYESKWDFGIFARQKTYIEHIVEEAGEPVEPWYNIKCAGMGERSKNLFAKTLGADIDLGKTTAEEDDFLKTDRTLEDFKIGLKVPSKLIPKNIKGGVLLTRTTFEMR